MAKLYSKKQNNTMINVKPSKESVNFILQYSKALRMVKIASQNQEILLN
jgi:hypothetical protein